MIFQVHSFYTYATPKNNFFFFRICKSDWKIVHKTIDKVQFRDRQNIKCTDSSFFNISGLVGKQKRKEKQIIYNPDIKKNESLHPQNAGCQQVLPTLRNAPNLDQMKHLETQKEVQNTICTLSKSVTKFLSQTIMTPQSIPYLFQRTQSKDVQGTS